MATSPFALAMNRGVRPQANGMNSNLPYNNIQQVNPNDPTGAGQLASQSTVGSMLGSMPGSSGAFMPPASSAPPTSQYQPNMGFSGAPNSQQNMPSSMSQGLMFQNGGWGSMPQQNSPQMSQSSIGVAPTGGWSGPQMSQGPMSQPSAPAQSQYSMPAQNRMPTPMPQYPQQQRSMGPQPQPQSNNMYQSSGAGMYRPQMSSPGYSNQYPNQSRFNAPNGSGGGYGGYASPNGGRSNNSWSSSSQPQSQMQSFK